mmetsp:Transcript_5074/g.18971  ORF Transcript_5074/g.18971 Transcript_5074/m.18971 type:complete len:598 (+) Transcript_5074:102-1895(+)
MAPGNGSLMRALGPTILSPGQFDRDALLVTLATAGKGRLVVALRQVAAAGEKSGELMLAEPVSKLMGHQDPEVCAAAVTAIGAMGWAASRFGEDIAEYLLKHPNVTCRIAALDALGKMGPGQSATVRGAVGECLRDQDPLLRQSALRALASMADSQHAEDIKALLTDASPGVRAAAIETLGHLVSISAEVESLYPPDALAQPLTELLADGRTRRAALTAVRLLGNKAPESCVGAVADAVADQDCEIRQAACHALGSLPLRCGAALPRLDELLRSSDIGIRAAAATAVGAIGPEAISLAGAVAQLLSDDGEDTSTLTSQMGAGCRRPPPQLRLPRCAALGALGRLGAAEHVKSAVAALSDPSWEVRKASCEALGAFGAVAREEHSALSAVLEDDAFPVRAMACYALGQLGSAEALAGLIEKFEDQAHSVRLHAVSAVGQLGEKAEEYAHDVFKLLNDPVAHVRASAAVALSRLGPSANPYAGVVAGLLAESDAEVRRASLEALGCMGRHGAALAEEIYEHREYDANAAVREAANQALASLGAAGFLAQEGPAALEDSGAGHEPGAEQNGFHGLGQHFAKHQETKKRVLSSGKWVEGLF